MPRGRWPRFEIIEHTAEVGIAAYGQDLSEAFANAAYGMFSLVVDPRTIAEDICREVEVKAFDRGALLVEWLNELLFLFDTEQLLFRRFQVTEMDEQHLQGYCFGQRVDPQRHHVKLGIKAATYHQLQVEVAHPCRVQVILDI